MTARIIKETLDEAKYENWVTNALKEAREQNFFFKLFDRLLVFFGMRDTLSVRTTNYISTLLTKVDETSIYHISATPLVREIKKHQLALLTSQDFGKCLKVFVIEIIKFLNLVMLHTEAGEAEAAKKTVVKLLFKLILQECEDNARCQINDFNILLQDETINQIVSSNVSNKVLVCGYDTALTDLIMGHQTDGYEKTLNTTSCSLIIFVAQKITDKIIAQYQQFISETDGLIPLILVCDEDTNALHEKINYCWSVSTSEYGQILDEAIKTHALRHIKIDNSSEYTLFISNSKQGNGSENAISSYGAKYKNNIVVEYDKKLFDKSYKTVTFEHKSGTNTITLFKSMFMLCQQNLSFLVIGNDDKQVEWMLQKGATKAPKVEYYEDSFTDDEDPFIGDEDPFTDEDEEKDDKEDEDIDEEESDETITKKEFSIADLGAYNGITNQQIYVGVGGQVFDVTNVKDYNSEPTAGKEITAYILGDRREVGTIGQVDLRDKSPDYKQDVRDKMDYFSMKYTNVGWIKEWVALDE